MVAPFREQLQELHTGEKNTVITHDRVIDDNLKTQIKNRTLYTSRLFLLTYPPSFFNIHSYSNKFPVFSW